MMDYLVNKIWNIMYISLLNSHYILIIHYGSISNP